MDLRGASLHQLELFYYVALYGGFVQASRKMPYAIAPSSLSRQICKLERLSAVRLYQRRECKLTGRGESLFEEIRPCFETLDGVMKRLMNGVPSVVRLAGSSVVLREYVPLILPALKRSYPEIRLKLVEGSQKHIEAKLKEKSVDVAITLVDRDPAQHYTCEPLLRLALTLLVPADSKIRSASELLRQPNIREKLIGLAPDNPVSHQFQQKLHQRGINWPISMEADSLELVASYVRKGLGIGLSLALPHYSFKGTGIRALPLHGFPYLTLGVIFPRETNAVIELLLKEIRRESKRLSRGR